MGRELALEAMELEPALETLEVALALDAMELELDTELEAELEVIELLELDELPVWAAGFG